MGRKVTLLGSGMTTLILFASVAVCGRGLPARAWQIQPMGTSPSIPRPENALAVDRFTLKLQGCKWHLASLPSYLVGTGGESEGHSRTIVCPFTVTNNMPRQRTFLQAYSWSFSESVVANDNAGERDTGTFYFGNYNATAACRGGVPVQGDIVLTGVNRDASKFSSLVITWRVDLLWGPRDEATFRDVPILSHSGQPVQGGVPSVTWPTKSVAVDRFTFRLRDCEWGNTVKISLGSAPERLVVCRFSVTNRAQPREVDEGRYYPVAAYDGSGTMTTGSFLLGRRAGGFYVGGKEIGGPWIVPEGVPIQGNISIGGLELPTASFAFVNKAASLLRLLIIKMEVARPEEFVYPGPHVIRFAFQNVPIYGVSWTGQATSLATSDLKRRFGLLIQLEILEADLKGIENLTSNLMWINCAPQSLGDVVAYALQPALSPQLQNDANAAATVYDVSAGAEDLVRNADPVNLALAIPEQYLTHQLAQAGYSCSKYNIVRAIVKAIPAPTGPTPFTSDTIAQGTIPYSPPLGTIPYSAVPGSVSYSTGSITALMQPTGRAGHEAVKIRLRFIPCASGYRKCLENSTDAASNTISPGAPAPSLTISVIPNQPWTDTGTRVSAGDTVSIAASGSIAFTTDGHVPPFPPAGYAPSCYAADARWPGDAAAFLAPQLPCYSLLGRIGNGPIFEVGVGTTFQARNSGELYLGVNDSFYRDNSGGWTATISNNSAASPGGSIASPSPPARPPAHTITTGGTPLNTSLMQTLGPATASPVTVAVSPARVAEGAQFTVSGIAKSLGGGPLEGVTVQISASVGGSTLPLTTVTTASDGSFRAVLNAPPIPGQVIITATVQGTSPPVRGTTLLTVTAGQ